MRTAEISRETRETKVNVTLCLDGGTVSVDTGVGFFNHMRALFGVRSGTGQPSACIGCRSCEAVCPQQLKISEAMADFCHLLAK